MEFDKKSLLNLIQENLKEMAMDFDTEDRPDSEIQRKLATGDTPYKDVPLPQTGDENKNFQEVLASDRYKQVVAKLRNYTGQGQTLDGTNGLFSLQGIMQSALIDILRTESQHREALENLAVELVKKEMGLDDDDIVFDAKIVGLGEIDTTDFNREQEPNQQQHEPEEIELDLMNDLENLSLEKAKRRVINMIIQGASKKGHYMFHNVEEKLIEITGNPNLLNSYGIMMSINDTLYWQASDDKIKMMMGNGGEGAAGVAGKESVDTQQDPPVVKAEGMNFPVLVHELIKGTLEVLAVHGRPEDEDTWSEVESQEDTLEKEMWDLRLGPALWERIRNQFPEDILTDENQYKLQNFLLIEIFKLPSREFFVFIREVLMETERGKRLMSELMIAVNNLFKDEEYEDEMDIFNDDLDDLSGEVDDDDLSDFLGSLGVGLSDDDE